MKKNTAVKKLISCNIKAARSRNIVADIAIALTAMMFTTVFTIGGSMLYSASELGARTGGSTEGVLVGAVVLAMIFGSGYLIIYNIFQISITRDIQLYGRLKTLGATGVQIRRIVYSQALRLCAAGIPIGLALGFGIGAVLIPIVLVSLGSAAMLSVHPVIFIGAALFSLLTVLLSCLKPAKIAAKVSPVAAVKYTGSDVDAKRNKTKKLGGTTTPYRMARNNLNRSRKRTALVVLSIAIGLALMNSFYVYQHSFSQEEYVKAFLESDVMLSTAPIYHASIAGEAAVQGMVTPQMLEEMKNKPDVVQIGAVWYAESIEYINPQVKARMAAYYEGEDGLGWWLQNYPEAARQYASMQQTGQTVVGVYGVDAYTADMGKVYWGEYDPALFATGNYALVYGIPSPNEASIHYSVGDMIAIGGNEYEVMALVDPVITVRGSLHSHQNELEIDYVIPSAQFLASFDESDAVSVFFETADEEARDSLAASLQEQYPNMETSTTLTYITDFKSQTLAVSATGYALGLIMALVGVLNFSNTMFTAIIARKQEFTMLESIGMTRRQLKTMLITEGMYYVLASLVLSIVAAVLIASTVIEESVSTSWVANYTFSLAPFAVTGPILVLLAVAIPIACLCGVQKDSLVTRLRSE